MCYPFDAPQQQISDNCRLGNPKIQMIKAENINLFSSYVCKMATLTFYSLNDEKWHKHLNHLQFSNCPTLLSAAKYSLFLDCYTEHFFFYFDGQLSNSFFQGYVVTRQTQMIHYCLLSSAFYPSYIIAACRLRKLSLPTKGLLFPTIVQYVIQFVTVT